MLEDNFRNEISLSTVETFYLRNKDLFDVAVDAVVRGCVKRYNFNSVVRKYFGTVTSFDGNEMYKVEITLDHSTGVKMTACDCPEDGICYHIGALALHSGYDVPIFSYMTDDSSDSNDSPLQPVQEAYVQSEILEPGETITSEKSTESSTSSNIDADISFDQVKSEISVDEKPDTYLITSATNNKKVTNDHQQKSAIKCEKCYRIFDNKFQFEVHQRYGHKDKFPVFQCTICSCQKHTKREMEIHMEKQHQNKFQLELHHEYKIPLFQCTICSCRKHTTRELEIHMKKKHQNKRCSKCGLFFLTFASKNAHFQMIHVDGKFCCDICPRYFLHHQFRCTTCRKTFNLTPYSRHIKGVHGIEPSEKTLGERVDKYECKICSQIFPTSGLHYKHLRTHPTFFQYSPSGEGFETNKTRTTHLRSRQHNCKQHQ